MSAHLRRQLDDFTDRLEDAREKLEDTSRCYQLLDKVTVINLPDYIIAKKQSIHLKICNDVTCCKNIVLFIVLLVLFIKLMLQYKAKINLKCNIMCRLI